MPAEAGGQRGRIVATPDVKALCFDVFGTVVDWRASIAREAAAAFASLGIERDWHAFADAWRARYQPAMEEVRSGRRPWTRLDVLHRENLLAVLDELAIEGLSASEIDRLNRAWHRLEPWPDVTLGLTRLKRTFILATLSNGDVAMMVAIARRAGLPWDAVLGAEVARAYKPQPEAYLRSAALLDLAPAACLMVAAHNSDLAAALALGFRTAYVHRPTEYGPGQSADLGPERDYDVVAASFTELADKLGC
jgi:2-haloacid dehalogenase